MFTPKMIENEKDFSCPKGHKLQALQINLDPKLLRNQRLFCPECHSDKDLKEKVDKIERLIQQIQDSQIQKTEKAENVITNQIKQLESLLSVAHEIQSDLLAQLEQIISTIKKWIENLIFQRSELYNYQYSFYDELEILINNENKNYDDFQKIIHNIQKSNNSWITKLNHKLEKCSKLEKQNQFREILQNLEYGSQIIQREPQQQFNSNSQLKINYDNEEILDEGQIKLKLIDQSVKQIDTCRAIVFNSSGSNMISTSDNDIKIWSFIDGKISLITTLSEHSDLIQCLVHSKRQNSFISGALDNKIICWQQKNQKNWIASQPYQQHTEFIRCIILNSNEDLLFSGSEDKSIKIWKVDFNQNKLTYNYSLIRHDNAITALSLNQSENYLVSCANKENQIIIWERTEENKFQFKYFVKQSILDCGFKIKFINEDQFIWISGSLKIDQLCIFELKNGIFEEMKEKTLQLKQNNFIYDENRFPIIQNKKKNLIVVRHKTFIYLIREMNNGFYKIVNELNCYENHIYGSITNNGQYLVFWDINNGGYSTYELLFN